MMLPLPKNISITGLLTVLPLQLFQNPKMSIIPMISFPQCQSSPIRGARMVETIAIETSLRTSQSSCAFTFPTHSWQDPLDRRRSTTLLLPKLHSIRNGITLLVRVHGTIPLLGMGWCFKGSYKEQIRSSFKGRTVFQGNNVKDEAADVALFAELGSSPANMEAGKALDAYGSMPGNRTSQGDGKQAYTQALTQGILNWIRLPRNRWPKEWIGVYKDPVVLLILALYGHPDSGGLWQRHCEKALYAVGFHPLYPECWPSMFWHPKLKLFLGVYVDDFKMSGPSKNIDRHGYSWRCR